MDTKKCLHCGKEFSPWYKTTKYCCRSCAHQSMKRRINKTCEVCSKPFETTQSADARFCSSDCFHKWHAEYRREHPAPLKRVERTCEWCNKTFEIWPSQLKQKITQGRFCSRDCMSAWKRTIRGENHPLKKEWPKLECAWCGKVYQVTPAIAHESKFCSRKCMGKHQSKYKIGENHPNYAGRITLTCEWCNKEYEKPPAIAKTSRFCSRHCQGCWTATHTGKVTRIELAIQKLLNDLGVHYIFQAKVGLYGCDFYLPDHKLIIETDGTYWHSLPANQARDKEKTNYLMNNGYRLLRLPESQITYDINSCKKQIVKALLPPNNHEQLSLF